MNEERKNYQLKFEGTGGEYFGIFIVNWLLTIVTLGFYYPWAKAKTVKYFYGATSINDNHFSFNGQGKEMFIGMLKFGLFFIIAAAVMFLFAAIKLQVLGIILLYVILIAIIPLALHGSMRYRMSRTSLRGIRFGYRGDRTTLIKEWTKMFLLTIVTLGFYGAWMEMKLRKYMMGNVRYGEVEGRFDGDGGEYFGVIIKGYLLTLVTLGIYSFWWQRDLFNYMMENTSFHKDEQKIEIKSTVTGGGIFKLGLVNILLLIFTLGIGYAWVAVRTTKYYTENLILEGDIDLASLTQTEEEYNNAFGDGALDFFDIDLF